MNFQAPFGFVTGCHARDKFLVQATLASMRQYCPGVPICLIVDGDVDVSDLKGIYGFHELRINDLESAEVRSRLASSPRAKLAAMWEGPFEHFVWMDSDAIVWGDFTGEVRRDLDFQIFWSEVSISPQEQVPPAWLKHYYFDVQKLAKFDSSFQWRGLAYFSNGVFACRRNAIPFELWVQVWDWDLEQDSPWPAHFFDMPMMNYLVHSMAQRGELKVGMSNLQHIWGHHGIAELEADCAGAGWHFPKQIKRPRIAHFCGQKPYLHMPYAYSRPFTIARLEHHRRKHGVAGAWLQLIKEEFPIVAAKIRRRLTPIKPA